MIGIITGDIINSQESEVENWLPPLKEMLSSWSESPQSWEIYRGDEFQVRFAVQELFQKALLLKSFFRSHENLDVRLALGIGNEVFSSEKITESSGSAYVNSGRLLTEIKAEGKTLAIKTDNDKVTRDLNILFKWASLEFDTWSVATAQIVHRLLKQTDLTQEELARDLAISQSSVSQRIKRGNVELILETDEFFRKKIADL